MRKLMMVCVLAGLPVLASAQYGAEGGMGQGGMGQGMGQSGMSQGGSGMGQGVGQRPPGPPQEFFTACKGKSEGDAASASGPRGQMQGTCRMVFVPSGAGQGQQQGQQGQEQRGGGRQGQGGQRPQ